MAMTVTYSVVPRKNPAKKDESAKYYAQAQASGELDFSLLFGQCYNFRIQRTG